MSKRQAVDIENGLEAWDAIVNDNLAIRRDNPTPVKSYTNPTSLPSNPGSDDEAIAITLTPFMLWANDGADWRPVRGEYVEAAERIAGYDEINDKVIYRQTFQFALANAGAASVAHGITGLDVGTGNYLKIEASASDGSRVRQLPWTDLGDYLDVQVDATDIIITSSADETATTATVTLFYTKT